MRLASRLAAMVAVVVVVVVSAAPFTRHAAAKPVAPAEVQQWQIVVTGVPIGRHGIVPPPAPERLQAPLGEHPLASSEFSSVVEISSEANHSSSRSSAQMMRRDDGSPAAEAAAAPLVTTASSEQPAGGAGGSWKLMRPLTAEIDAAGSTKTSGSRYPRRGAHGVIDPTTDGALGEALMASANSTGNATGPATSTPASSDEAKQLTVFLGGMITVVLLGCVFAVLWSSLNRQELSNAPMSGQGAPLEEAGSSLDGPTRPNHVETAGSGADLLDPPVTDVIDPLHAASAENTTRTDDGTAAY